MLYLAVAGAISNALFPSAQAERTDLTRVVVRVSGNWEGDPPVADAIAYDVEVAGDAQPD